MQEVYMKSVKTMLLGIAMICFGNSLSLLNMFGTNGGFAAAGLVIIFAGVVVFLVSFFRKTM